SGEIPTRPIEARNKTGLDRVECGGEDDRYRAGQSFGGACRGSTGSGNHGHSPTNEISRQFRQPALVILAPAEFDRHVAALALAHFAQALAEVRQVTGPFSRRAG